MHVIILTVLRARLSTCRQVNSIGALKASQILIPNRIKLSDKNLFFADSLAN